MKLTRDEFIDVMAEVMFGDREWASMALDEFLATEGIRYGDDAYLWEEWAARELADIEISY